MTAQKNIIIIGNGIAGITAARHIRKRNDDHNITVISAETDHFFSRTALMYIYLGHMKYEHTKPYEDWFWEKNRIKLKRAYVSKVEPILNSILLDSGELLTYDELIIASGSASNKFGWPGQDLKGVQGLYNYQDLESMEANTKGIERAVVVGGGLIGIEMVEMLRSRQIPVTFLVREASFWEDVLPKEESEMINRHIRSHHVDLRLKTDLKEILSDENGIARAVLTGDGEEISCQFVGLTVGVHPNISFLKNSGIETDKGILVNEKLQTNFSNIYALGDCAQLRMPREERRAIESVWYTGKMMGETVAATICGQPTNYNPGIWFNSAKFMDIEYQTYGYVSAHLKEGEESLYWEAEDGVRCLRIVYESATKSVVGFNAFGIRLRHQVCDEWLKNRTHVDEVISNLNKANFNPEFFKKFVNDVKFKSMRK
ncbi:MAG: FAD-dependent oxidoreductase [Flavobacteriales bacterium]|nr:FAD-dependent oxidoreductase [Flavobacteriales bacterium]